MATAKPESDDTDRPKPFTEQVPFLWNDKKYYGYISGVGAGKTFGGIFRTALNAEQWNRGEMGAIVAPTTTMIKDVIIPQMREIGLLDRWTYKSAHTDEPGLHTPDDGRILLLSADNRRTIERLAGLNLAYWWLDEATRVPPRAQEILTQRLRVGNYRNGYVTTTPMGKDHVYDFFVGNYEAEGTWGEHGEADIFYTGDRLAITRVPTWANPHTADDYKEEMEAKEGQVYEREILGRFVNYEGLIYGWFDDRKEGNHVVDSIDANVSQMFYGVDWGHNNPACILALAETTRDEIVVIDELYESGLDHNEMLQVAQRMQDQYGSGPFYCDPAEPASIDTFQREGLNAIDATNDVMAGIQHVSAQRDRLRVHERCVNLRDEFGMYRYADDSDHEQPLKANDHSMDALRYALLTHAEKGIDNVGVYFG